MEDVVIVGGGPCGISAAAELTKNNINPLIIEKGCIVNSIYNYPTYMHFFSTAELLEIGNVPFMTTNEKPTRLEALHYYRTVAERKKIRIHTYEAVKLIEPRGDCFSITTENQHGQTLRYEAKQVILATGYFDQPNALNIPGENLSKVSHYYKDGHPYHRLKVAVVGGNNSAVDAAMDLERAGAQVTMIYRRDELSRSVKAWVRPVFDSLVDKGRIQMMWNANVKEIKTNSITVDRDGSLIELENDFVFALTGFHPNRQMLLSIGVRVDPETNIPHYDPETMETNVPGLYIAGVIAAGNDANVIFIENGRLHGEPIAKAISGKLNR